MLGKLDWGGSRGLDWGVVDPGLGSSREWGSGLYKHLGPQIPNRGLSGPQACENEWK